MEKNHEKFVQDLIVAIFPGQYNFTREETAKIIGCTAGHLRNMESAKTPLLPSVSLGRKKYYQLPDLISFLANQKTEKRKLRRGARSKQERIEAKGDTQ